MKYVQKDFLAVEKQARHGPKKGRATIMKLTEQYLLVITATLKQPRRDANGKIIGLDSPSLLVPSYTPLCAGTLRRLQLRF